MLLVVIPILEQDGQLILWIDSGTCKTKDWYQILVQSLSSDVMKPGTRNSFSSKAETATAKALSPKPQTQFAFRSTMGLPREIATLRASWPCQNHPKSDPAFATV